jgi:hypothetical protein
MNRLQYDITVLKGELIHSTYSGKNFTFKAWLTAKVQSSFENRYRTFLIEQTYIDESKTLYQLNP